MPTRPLGHRARVGVAAGGTDRLKTAERGYGWRWQQYRLAFLRREPLCAECARQGRVAAATCVDHIEPHRGDQRLFWDKANHQGLCASCHSRKTAAEDGGFGNGKMGNVAG